MINVRRDMDYVIDNEKAIRKYRFRNKFFSKSTLSLEEVESVKRIIETCALLNTILTTGASYNLHFTEDEYTMLQNIFFDYHMMFGELRMGYSVNKIIALDTDTSLDVDDYFDLVTEESLEFLENISDYGSEESKALLFSSANPYEGIMAIKNSLVNASLQHGDEPIFLAIAYDRISKIKNEKIKRYAVKHD